MQSSDGMHYAPKGKPAPVVKPGEFVFAAVGLDHGHIGGMCNGLMEAGATLKWIYDPDPAKVEQYCKMYPQARAARSEAEVLEDPEVRLVAGACVTSQRCALGLRVIAAGKDYFTDKAPLTTLEQLAAARKATAETGRKYMCYYSERLHVESAVYAGHLIAQGAIGKVLNVTGFGPHRLGAAGRPKWFFEKEKYGGILCDIGSHQIEQFLFFAGEEDARVQFSRVANYAHPEYPELEDYGDCSIVGANGATNYFRVDWFTPDGLRTWGDGTHLYSGHPGLYRDPQVYRPGAAGTGGRSRAPGEPGRGAALPCARPGGLPLLRGADPGLPPPHGKRHDPGPLFQGGGAVRPGGDAGADHRPARADPSRPPALARVRGTLARASGGFAPGRIADFACKSPFWQIRMTSGCSNLLLLQSSFITFPAAEKRYGRWKGEPTSFLACKRSD